MQTILEVVDTRQYEQSNGKWRPVSGSGEPHECEACGASHEVWVYVKDLETGKRGIIGTTCAKKSASIYTSQKYALGKNYIVCRLNGAAFESAVEKIRAGLAA